MSLTSVQNGKMHACVGMHLTDHTVTRNDKDLSFVVPHSNAGNIERPN